NRSIKGGIHLVGIMATTIKAPNFLIAHAADHLKQFGVLAKKVFAHISTIIGLIGLVFTIYGFFHDTTQNTFFVASQQRIPVTAPNQLNDIPATATEITLQFLDDFAITTNRAIKTLQVAVDHKNKV